MREDSTTTVPMTNALSERDGKRYLSSSSAQKDTCPLTVSEFTRLLLVLKKHGASRQAFLKSSGSFLPKEPWDEIIAPAFNSTNVFSGHNISTRLTNLVSFPTPLCPEIPPAIEKNGRTLRRTLRTFRDAFTAALLMCDRSSLAVNDLRTYFFLVGFDLSKPLTACFLIAAHIIGLENEDEKKTDIPLLRKLCFIDPGDSGQSCFVQSTCLIVHDIDLFQLVRDTHRGQENFDSCSKASTFSYSTDLDNQSVSSKQEFKYAEDVSRKKHDSFSTSLGTDPTLCSTNDKDMKSMTKELSIITKRSGLAESRVHFFERRERLIQAFSRASKERESCVDHAVQQAWEEQYQLLLQVLFPSQMRQQHSFSSC